MRDSDYDLITLEATQEGLAVVTLNRPDVHNAFNAELVAELTDAFKTISDQPTIRMMILRGAGQSFSSGTDINWIKLAKLHTREDNERDAMHLAEMLRSLYDMPQMTLALVQGAVMGGGNGLVAACDVAVAMKDTKFCFSEVRLGLTPATVGPYVIEAIGPRWARALFTTAETFDAGFAEKIGLVQYVVDTQADMTAMEEHLADLVFAAAPGAISASKSLVRDVSGVFIEKDLSQETSRRMAARRASEEGEEGMAAFLEKRSPGWSR